MKEENNIKTKHVINNLNDDFYYFKTDTEEGFTSSITTASKYDTYNDAMDIIRDKESKNLFAKKWVVIRKVMII